MNVSVSMFVVFGIIAVFLIRFQGLRIWHAFVVTMFGFFLASSPAAPTITSWATAVINWFTGER